MTDLAARGVLGPGGGPREVPARGAGAPAVRRGRDHELTSELGDDVLWRVERVEARLVRLERLVRHLADLGREAALLRLEAEERAAEDLGALLVELDDELSMIRSEIPKRAAAALRPVPPPSAEP